jgi:hypothetical protein
VNKMSLGGTNVGLISRFRTWLNGGKNADVVTFDNELVTCRLRDGRTMTVRWDNLQTVLIETTDAGPFEDDIFWVLMGEESNCVVPSEAIGIKKLLKKIQILPGFDYEPATKAMSCTENKTFICWKKN